MKYLSKNLLYLTQWPRVFALLRPERVKIKRLGTLVSRTTFERKMEAHKENFEEQKNELLKSSETNAYFKFGESELFEPNKYGCSYLAHLPYVVFEKIKTD